MSALPEIAKRQMGDGARFLVFSGDTYYPAPGWRGLVGSAVSIEEARSAVAGDDEFSWWQIVDLDSMEIVEGSGQGHTGMGGYVMAGPVK